VLNWNTIEIDSFETTNINCGRPVALGIDSFRVWVNAAGVAKAVLDNVLVESVRADVGFGCKQA
jgi:ABC-type uncharacterized transport system substrate-binding protein